MSSLLIAVSQSGDLGDLLHHGWGSDVMLCVNGQEFAHRGVLAARSAVFRAMFAFLHVMFKHGVEITDVERDVVSEMLNFIYTGKAPCSLKFWTCWPPPTSMRWIGWKRCVRTHWCRAWQWTMSPRSCTSLICTVPMNSKSFVVNFINIHTKDMIEAFCSIQESLSCTDFNQIAWIYTKGLQKHSSVHPVQKFHKAVMRFTNFQLTTVWTTQVITKSDYITKCALFSSHSENW